MTDDLKVLRDEIEVLHARLDEVVRILVRLPLSANEDVIRKVGDLIAQLAKPVTRTATLKLPSGAPISMDVTESRESRTGRR